MQLNLFLLAIILTLLVSVTAEKERKHKKYRKPHKTPSNPSAIQEDEVNMMEEDGEDEALRIAEALAKQQELERENERAREAAEDSGLDMIDNRVPLVDPCSRVHCGAGRICQLDEQEEPQCVCIPDCPEETEPRRKICSNHNETWPSDCAVYQHRCWCDTGDKRCKGSDFRHVHIEYYGVCREMPECKKEEMADFPRRMRDWLFNVMRDMADRHELTPHYLKMEREAETNLTRRWTNAAIWKWCDLDGHPHDRSVSRHELFPIRAPLMSLEHCIAPFLDKCDTDNDHRITITEWGKCLELDEDDLEEKCDEIIEENN